MRVYVPYVGYRNMPLKCAVCGVHMILPADKRPSIAMTPRGNEPLCLACFNWASGVLAAHLLLSR